MTPAVIESMTRFVHHGRTIRVWRTEPRVQESYDTTELAQVVRAWKPGLGVPALVTALSNVLRVSAVEIVDEHGDGIVVYYEWP